MKLQTLNASLRLKHYMEHNQTFPDDEELLPNLEAKRLEHKLALEALMNEAEVALGCWLEAPANSKQRRTQDHVNEHLH